MPMGQVVIAHSLMLGLGSALAPLASAADPPCFGGAPEVTVRDQPQAMDLRVQGRTLLWSSRGSVHSLDLDTGAVKTLGRGTARARRPARVIGTVVVGRADPIAIVEACYSLEHSNQEWLANLTTCAARVFGAGQGALGLLYHLAVRPDWIEPLEFARSPDMAAALAELFPIPPSSAEAALQLQRLLGYTGVFTARDLTSGARPSANALAAAALACATVTYRTIRFVVPPVTIQVSPSWVVVAPERLASAAPGGARDGGPGVDGG
jgi:hypothetical protein